MNGTALYEATTAIFIAQVALLALLASSSYFDASPVARPLMPQPPVSTLPRKHASLLLQQPPRLLL
jgi:hypothetical protein